MRFADPTSCPECRGVIAGESACPHCGFDLLSIEARQLWQTLLQADELLARAAQRPRVATAAAPAPTPAQAQAQAQSQSQAPAQAQTPFEAPFLAAPAGVASYPAPPPRMPASPHQAAPPAAHRPWPVGSILLVLGALGLMVAGLIFVTRSWDSIGLAGKAAILLGVTVVFGALGAWVTRRKLRASAEAVWSVFLALLTLDVFAARHEDLAGLGTLGPAWMCVVWGAIALALSVLIAVWARPRVSVELLAPALAGGLAITMAGIGAGAVGDDLDFAWRAFIALVVAGVLALATRPAGLPHLTLTARIVVAGFFGAAYIAALVEIVEHPVLDDLVGGGHGGPMLLMGLASLVIARVVPVVRIAATALAVLAACALVVTPVADAGGEDATWATVAVLAAALAAAGCLGDTAWMRGVRLGAVPALAGIVGLHAGLAADVLATVGRIIEDPWQAAWDDRLDVLSVENYAAWAVLVAVAALIMVAAAVPRWPELTFARPDTPVIVGSAIALGAVNGVIAWRLPVWAVAVALLGVALVMAALHVRGLVKTLAPVAAVLFVAAAFLAAPSQGVSAGTWLVGGAALALLALSAGDEWLQHVCAVGAAVLLLIGVAALTDLLADDGSVTSFATVVAALALLVSAGLPLRDRPVRPTVEAMAMAGGLIALVVPASSSEVALRWTVAGVVLIALSFVVESRRWYVWPGIAALVVAYIALIVDSGFSFVEAYTLPLGAAALATGLFFLRNKPDASTWTYLGPGLAIALLPSVPQALVDPTELRALLLGLAALVVLAVGARLGWQAPFAAGAAILVLLIVFNIGPYANAAPRVVLIAAVSAVLLGFGISWEDRVRDGRKLVAYLGSMR